MIKIAIVGNIASGKSTVEKLLKDLDYVVYDTDLICHDLLENSQEVMEAFQCYDILENSKISREKMGRLVFDSLELKQKLESILYPLLKTKLNKIFQENISRKFVFVSIPLLFEAKMENLFDKILFIYCEDVIRLERLMLRNNYSREYAIKRMNSQMPQSDKISLADFVIDNNSDIQNLHKNLIEFLNAIK